MPSYPTLDDRPDLVPSQMTDAPHLVFSKYTNPLPDLPIPNRWDNEVNISTGGAITPSLFSWQGKAGATYDFFTSSFFDPYLIQVYDNLGNEVAEGSAGSTYGSKALYGFVAPYSGTYSVSTGWNKGAYHTYVYFSINEDVDTIGIPQGFHIDGTNSNDSLFGRPGNDIIDGRAGIDSVIYPGARANYTISRAEDTIIVLDNSGNGGKDLIKNVESLWFGDKEVSFQDVGPAAEAYRIYQAAFDRAADPQGLLYWKTAIEKGVSATEVAQMFINSDEFKLKYGNAPTPSHLLDGFYANVLHRAPDASGYQFWLDHLNDGSTSVASVLAAFSDSPENQAQVIGAIKNGIEYMHWAWQ